MSVDTETPSPGTTEWWRLDDAGLVAALAEQEQLLRRTQARQGQILAEIHTRGPMRAYGYADAVGLQRDVLHLSPREAKRRLDRALACHDVVETSGVRPALAPATAAAFAAGAIGAEHVDEIRAILAQIPGHVSAEDRAAYEQTLAELARKGGPHPVRKAGQHLLERLNQDDKPDDDGTDDGADDEELVHPERELRWQWRDGHLKLAGFLDTEAGHLLETLISPLAAPRPADNGTRDPRSVAQRQGDALAELLEFTQRATQLPADGGQAPVLVVTMTLEQLLARNPLISPEDAAAAMKAADPRLRPEEDARSKVPALTGATAAAAGDPIAGDPATLSGTAPAGEPPTLNYTTPITAEQARRLACEARIVPMVLGSTGVPLDLGRETRLATPAQRRALAQRDRGCIFDGCTRPVRWTVVHHIRYWTADQGPSDLDNLCLLCAYHHRLVHHSEWEIRMAADGHPVCIPPQWMDPERKPRRNHAHDPIPPPRT